MVNRAFRTPEIVEADCGQRAIELCDSERIDCVLLDAATSSFDEVLSSLALRTQGGHIPLVLMVGDQERAQRDLGEQQGISDWLFKESFSAQTVELTVRKAIEVSSLRLMLNEQGRELDRLREESAARADAAALAEADRAASTSVETNEAEAVDDSTSATVVSDESASDAEMLPKKSAIVLAGPKLVTNGFGTPTAEEEELARRIHTDLMPPGSPLLEGYDVAGLSLPAETTGGDYYDYLPMSDDLLAVTIGECSGRGVAPAVLMASLRAYLRVVSRSTMDVSDVLSQVNTLITDDIGDEEFLVTLMMVQIDTLTKQIRYASAGHQAHLIERSGEAHVLPSTGMPMGLRVETVIPEGEPRKLNNGDLLLLASDGAQKITSVSGEKFGTERVLELVRKNRELPSRMIVNYLKRACAEFAGPQGQNDDITAVVIKAEDYALG